MKRLLPWVLVSRMLAVLLFAAAALKLQGLAVDPVARSGLFSAPEFQAGLVLGELCLAAWLLSAMHPLGSWLTSLVIFSCFSWASAYQGWIGHASCGCFGALAVNPWYAFGLDVLVLGALLIGRPDLQPLRENPRSSVGSALRPLACGFLGIAAFLALLAGLAHVGFGSTEGALAYLRGERLSVQARIVDMGSGLAGETRSTTIELHNWTDQPIRLVGGTSDCSCVVTDDLPVAILPGKGCSVKVKVRLPQAKGTFTRSAFLWTDDDLTRVLSFRLTGRITQPPAKAVIAETSGGG